MGFKFNYFNLLFVNLNFYLCVHLSSTEIFSESNLSFTDRLKAAILKYSKKDYLMDCRTSLGCMLSF